jgi:hypothetical protein
MAFIDFDVDMLERYLDVVEAQLRETKVLEISAYRERRQVGKEAEGEEEEYDLRGINERHEQYVRFARYAFLMLTLMIFEARAKEFCKYVIVLGKAQDLPVFACESFGQTVAAMGESS